MGIEAKRREEVGVRIGYGWMDVDTTTLLSSVDRRLLLSCQHPPCGLWAVGASATRKEMGEMGQRAVTYTRCVIRPDGFGS
ncbi:hypothetical protein BRADI_2g58882v3 [Brachypodium distachyon]|uniref:Uncharacterized protein n=1 Tax=Brachypodium distachyon TaxID=15368 RepID=A0A2K2DGR8_BRADI|nr:hypothetical protein BRADI_2g58882v3 [Brachypodium distachyon]PNT73473.1 hypothetical protein BRADI_2g58882v3 [Brachypodium distachyon]